MQSAQGTIWHRPMLYRTIVSIYIFFIGAISFVFFLFLGLDTSLYGLIFVPLSVILAIPAFVLGNIVLRGSKVGVIISMVILALSIVGLGWYIINNLYEYHFSLRNFSTIAPIPLMALLGSNSVMFVFLVKSRKSTNRISIIITKKVFGINISVAKIILVFVAIVIIASIIHVNAASDGKFVDPTGVSVSKSGYIYVIDWSQHRIQKFDNSGSFITSWASDGGSRLVLDTYENVYVINGDTQQVTKFTSYGLALKTIGYSPVSHTTYGVFDGVAVDSKGNIFWTDEIGDKIKEYNSDGDFVAEWNSFQGPDGNETMIAPDSIAIDSHDDLYVLGTSTNPSTHEEENSKIYKFKIVNSGNSECNNNEHKVAKNVCFVTRWMTSPGRGIAVDPHGYVYVGQWASISKFTGDGSFVKTFGSFVNVEDIAIDPSGYVYVVDGGTNQNRVVKFTTDGQSVLSFGSPLYYVK